LNKPAAAKGPTNKAEVTRLEQQGNFVAKSRYLRSAIGTSSCFRLSQPTSGFIFHRPGLSGRVAPRPTIFLVFSLSVDHVLAARRDRIRTRKPSSPINPPPPQI